MKQQLVVENANGKIVKSTIENISEEEYKDLLELIKSNLNYLSFVDEHGNTVVIKKTFLENSIITFTKEI